MSVTILLSHNFRQRIFPFLRKTLSPFLSLIFLGVTALGKPFLMILMVPQNDGMKIMFFGVENTKLECTHFLAYFFNLPAPYVSLDNISSMSSTEL